MHCKSWTKAIIQFSLSLGEHTEFVRSVGLNLCQWLRKARFLFQGVLSCRFTVDMLVLSDS